MKYLSWAGWCKTKRVAFIYNKKRNSRRSTKTSSRIYEKRPRNIFNNTRNFS